VAVSRRLGRQVEPAVAFPDEAASVMPLETMASLSNDPLVSLPILAA
jgi:hypothetical protein